jgi:hypothetical protein
VGTWSSRLVEIRTAAGPSAPCSVCLVVARTHGIAGAAVPARVSASAVAEAGDMPDEDLIRAERVAVRAATRWPGNPLAIRGLRKVTEHDSQPRT